MSWIGKLFGTEKAVDSLLNPEKGLIAKAGTAIGNLHYSDQEKAENALKTQEWAIRFLDAMAPFKIVQRLLAFATMFAWVFLIVNLAVAIWIQALHPEINAVTAFKELAFSDFVFYPIMAVFVLYTGGGTINSFKGNK